MKVLIRLATCLVTTLLLAQLASAQVPDKFTNLKVLPKEITRAELVETMKGFAMGLGVRCSSCHMGEEGKPLNTYDFTSDEKRMKQNARIMLQMVRNINEKDISRIQLEDGAKPVTATCFSCHRGKKQPETKAPMPPPPPAAAPATLPSAPPKPTA